jgi:hypothetical protein
MKIRTVRIVIAAPPAEAGTESTALVAARVWAWDLAGD